MGKKLGAEFIGTFWSVLAGVTYRWPGKEHQA